MAAEITLTPLKKNAPALFTQDDKPTEHILALQHALTPFGKKCSFPAGKKIRLFHNGIRHWFLLQSGEMSACRDSDGLILESPHSPA
ncbi:hypothetical protein [Serratia plymuthica]|uniref:hypothetical protein n=1 Tax=Serratia plymuthica TaxID=82996 RepID=UPI001419B732|nr:hypothetical protein [Serratia plymuthica]NIC29518.1 hypothetical protein [Serratia plymuthica]